MTTDYTATVDISTPGQTLTDFTAVVPAGLGVNAYGAGTGADINTFDIGPTGDSNILLQTLDSGGATVSNGVCHDSAHGTVPSYGVHGLYDKAIGTIVETMEFYEHPNGYGYSPRYSNSCYQSQFHDTPNCVGLFNYQGAATGSGGSLRIRDCTFYNLPADGIVFYSDGVWRAADGTILGDSLISVEIDHCTIDARGCSDPFPFQDCHNDVYLTNCVIISDSGLPLSSIVVAPSDGSTLHLDGSIVLDSADAATYLGPAPTFTPIAVGGSPVIGTAVASPPASFAQWGNEGDIGAAQTGSTPPGPPPLPGPAVPAVMSLGLVGTGEAFGTNIVTIPVGFNIPRSDPSAGATIIIVTLFTDDASISPAQIVAVVDDGETDSFYGTCLIEDGLNSYVESPVGLSTATGNLGTAGAFVGLILNPLDDTNTITITAADAYGYLFAFAHAYTGVNCVTSALIEAATSAIFMFSGGIGSPPNPLGVATCTGSSQNLEWTSTPGVVIGSPSCTGPTDWEWFNGAIAVYWNFFVNSFGSTTGMWTWTDGDIVTQDEWDDVATSIGDDSYSLVYAEQTITPPQGSIDVSGGWADVGEFGTNGAGAVILPGFGPTCPVAPPTGGYPVFNNHIRLSE